MYYYYYYYLKRRRKKHIGYLFLSRALASFGRTAPILIFLVRLSSGENFENVSRIDKRRFLKVECLLSLTNRTNTSNHGEMRRHRVIIKTYQDHQDKPDISCAIWLHFSSNSFRGKSQFDPKYHIIIRAS